MMFLVAAFSWSGNISLVKPATWDSLPKVSFRADPASDWASVHILSACRAVAQVALISFANIASPSTTSYSPAPYHVTSQHALLLLGSPPPPVKLIQRSVVICKIIMLTPTQLPASDNVRLKFILFLSHFQMCLAPSYILVQLICAHCYVSKKSNF